LPTPHRHVRPKRPRLPTMPPIRTELRDNLQKYDRAILRSANCTNRLPNLDSINERRKHLRKRIATLRMIHFTPQSRNSFKGRIKFAITFPYTNSDALVNVNECNSSQRIGDSRQFLIGRQDNGQCLSQCIGQSEFRINGRRWFRPVLFAALR